MKMMAVSVLKTLFSQSLARVKAGEELVVTEHGKPIAKLIPISPQELGLRAALADLERAGLVKIGTGKIPPAFWNLPRPSVPDGSVVKALMEDREEGR